jgi:predicted DNA-binding transcriptional regulator YafY
MPVNKLVKLRHRVIDDCFRKNSNQGLTLQALIDAVNHKLSLEGCQKISKRTIQNDLEELKNNGAPIETKRNGREHLLYYSDPNFSIEKSPISEKDKSVLQEAAQLLKQFEDLPHFEGLKETLLQINCWKDTAQQALIQFEKNEYEVNVSITEIYESVKNEKSLLIDYQDFNKEKLEKITLHPYFMKEFRNRWYIVGQEEKSGKIYNLALDRIKKVVPLDFKPFLPYPADFAPDAHFKDVIGVTLLKNSPLETIRFKASPLTAPYLQTKKLHHSQTTIGKDESDDWTIFELRVRQNYELIAEFRRLGNALEVIAPESLRATMKAEFEALAKRYA